MVQAYLRYEQTASFGVICSNCNVVYDRSGRLLITAALESIVIWNIKKGTLVLFHCQYMSFSNACAPPPFIARHLTSSAFPAVQVPRTHHEQCVMLCCFRATQVQKLEVARSSDSAPAPAEVTQLAVAPTGDQLAAGYADGTVRIWSLDTNECTVTFSGHKVRTNIRASAFPAASVVICAALANNSPAFLGSDRPLRR